MKFKKILQEEMSSSGMIKSEVCELLEISAVTLNSYLSGKTSPSFDKSIQIMDKFKKKVFIVSLYGDNDYFFTSQNENP